MTGSPRLASTFPAPEDGRCAPYCHLRQWARDLDPYVLPRAQFGGHILLPPVPMSVCVCVDIYIYGNSQKNSSQAALRRKYDRVLTFVDLLTCVRYRPRRA